MHPQRQYYFPIFVLFFAALLYAVHFSQTRPCHCRDGLWLILAQFMNNNNNNNSNENEWKILFEMLIAGGTNSTEEILEWKLDCLPVNSPLAGTFCKPFEPWRLFSSALVHEGIGHLLGNLFLLFIFGLFFEIRHGSRLACIVVMFGIFAAYPFLAGAFVGYGASAGIYSLIGAVFIDLMILLKGTLGRLFLQFTKISSANWKPILKTILLLLLQLSFFGVPIFDNVFVPKLFGEDNNEQISISHESHFAEFLSGFLAIFAFYSIGAAKNASSKKALRWIAFAAKIALGIWIVFLALLHLATFIRALTMAEILTIEKPEGPFDEEYAEEMDFHQKSVNFCKAYKNPKNWQHPMRLLYKKAAPNLKRPSFCWPISILYILLHWILTIFCLCLNPSCFICFFPKASIKNSKENDENEKMLPQMGNVQMEQISGPSLNY